MNNPKIPTGLFVLMLLLAGLQWARVYPELPDRMASKFGPTGQPTGWETKSDFFTMIFIVVVICAFVSFVLPRVLGLLPPQMINLPNKHYWFAPERRDETSRVMAAHMAWFGCGLLFVLLDVTSLAINANRPGGEPFNTQSMPYILAGFFVFSIFCFVHMLRRFYSVPPSSSSW
jgi:uncharacterized membrane protein